MCVLLGRRLEVGQVLVIGPVPVPVPVPMPVPVPVPVPVLLLVPVRVPLQKCRELSIKSWVKCCGWGACSEQEPAFGSGSNAVLGRTGVVGDGLGPGVGRGLDVRLGLRAGSFK